MGYRHLLMFESKAVTEQVKPMIHALRARARVIIKCFWRWHRSFSSYKIIVTRFRKAKNIKDGIHTVGMSL